MHIAVYSAAESQPSATAAPDDLPALLTEEGKIVWVDMVGPTPDETQVMRDVFHFHPLAIDDTLNQRQRPKVEEYSGYLFSILNSVSCADGEIEFRELDMFAGRNYVVTVHPVVEPAVEEARGRIDESCTLMPMTAGYLLYVLVDVIVDSYFPVLDTISDDIETIGEQVLERPQPQMLARLFRLRRSLNEMWRVTGQQRDMFSVLTRDKSDVINQESLRYYLRDVYDHLLRISDSVNTFRDTLTSMVDLYMSSVSNRLNRQVNRLTIITVGIGILAVITGFYGMNFERTWPPFEARWGVAFVLTLIALVIAGVLYVLRHERED